MKKPRAWTFEFDHGNIGPHISLSAKIAANESKFEQDSAAQSDGKAFHLQSAWGDDLHFTCAQHIKH